MPAQNGLGLDDEEGIFPGLQATGKQDDKRAIGAGELRAFDRTIEDDQLVTKQQVLRNQLGFAASEVSESLERKTVNDRLGRARDGGAGGLEPAFHYRLNALEDPEHHLPPSYCLETAPLAVPKQYRV